MRCVGVLLFWFVAPTTWGPMHIDEPPDDAELALHELRRLVHGIRTASCSVETSHFVTGAQLFVLRELSFEPGASIRRLSERTLTDPSSVSVIVARLVTRGLVSRTTVAADRRKSALMLSKRGVALLARSPEPYQTRLIRALRALPVPDLVVVRDALARMAGALGLETEAEAPLFFEDPAPKRSKARGRRS